MGDCALDRQRLLIQLLQLLDVALLSVPVRGQQKTGVVRRQGSQVAVYL